ncbi:MAG: hypothetical protein EOO36_21865 [Cytophagaceae bacterium]|nr:MAG: hypothetical protein EOO36_21865 [Cytophagaceae bacterium]
MHHRISRALAALEAEHGIRILYACESGSRAWGFPSPDSTAAWGGGRVNQRRSAPETLVLRPALGPGRSLDTRAPHPAADGVCAFAQLATG